MSFTPNPPGTRRGESEAEGGNIRLSPVNGATYFLVPEHAFDHSAKRYLLTIGTPRVLVEQ